MPTTSNKQISVVLGSYNRLFFLKLTIQSIRQEVHDIFHEIIVVDGGSDDGSLQWLVAQKDIITIIQHNRGIWDGKQIERRAWGYFMNLAFKCAQGKYVCMLSDDCLVVPGAIKNGYNVFEQALAAGRKIGAVAFYWRDWSTQKKYHVGCTLGNKMYVNHGLYLNDALKAVDYIDEENYFFYSADGDLCLKMWQQGHECIDSQSSFIEHYPHANLGVRKTNYMRQKPDTKNYLKKWTGIFYDPKLDNQGVLLELEFDDKFNTGQQFDVLHKQVIAINPAILKPKPFYSKIAKKCNFIFKSLLRRLNLQ
jgi:glycosyltransferase involved in cell wall biosynthesis